MKKFFILIFLFCFTLNPQIIISQVLDDPIIELVDQGFNFIEGPVWKEGAGLLFSDIPENKIYVWDSTSGSSLYYTPSGKSNGLALDAEGNLILCQHLDRQVGKYTEGVGIEPLASHYNGKRFNSPNDLAIKSDGSIFFTDPPFGLNDENATPELPYSGIYRLTASGDVQLLDSTLRYPNGIAFSPDESKLYVTESDVADIYVWDVIDDTTIANKSLFYDIPGQWGDGMKIDEEGYLYVTGPVGVWIFAPDGGLSETVAVTFGSSASNCGWGPQEEPTLYVTSNSRLYKIINRPKDPSAFEDLNPDVGMGMTLGTPHPNPFNISTKISVYLENSMELRLSVLNMNGEEISILVDGDCLNGLHTINWNTSELACGIYYIVLESKEGKLVRKCIKQDNQG